MTTRAAAFLVAVLVLGPAAAGARPPKRPVPPPPLPRARSADAGPAVVVSAETAALLAKLGWKALRDGGLVRVEGADHGRVPTEVLENASFLWKNGAIVYDTAFTPVEPDKLGPILRGLADFAELAAMNPQDVGRAVAGFGLPPSYDGSPILNPDGSATYYGLVLYSFYVRHPDALKLLSYERLAEALARLSDAHDQAFKKQAPDVAHDEIQVVWGILSAAPARAGEKPLGLKPYPDLGATLAQYEKLLVADQKSAAVKADPALKSQGAQALAVLKNLKGQRYATELSIVPPPDTDSDDAKKKAAAAPLSSGLPVLLRALDRVNGRPLTPEQRQALVESFPMGELVWRLGVSELWSQGFTGKGVKVAVIDGGVGPNAELDGAVKDRQNFTAQRGAALADPHGTHVAGIIHQLAPDAEIRSYAAVGGDDTPSARRAAADGGSNPKLAEDSDEPVMNAIRKAVADGNTIINLSLGGKGAPSEPISRLVEEYARKGVLISVAAGNERNTQSVESPSNALGALSVGSINVSGRMSEFSSHGLNYDPRRMAYVIKDIFLTPGQNIRSTLPGDEYGTMSGTSMATPALNGVLALLAQAASFNPAPDPITTARRVEAALRAGSSPLSLDGLPPDVSLAQKFLVVNPPAALRALQAQAIPVAGK